MRKWQKKNGRANEKTKELKVAATDGISVPSIPITMGSRILQTNIFVFKIAHYNRSHFRTNLKTSRLWTNVSAFHTSRCMFYIFLNLWKSWTFRLNETSFPRWWFIRVTKNCTCIPKELRAPDYTEKLKWAVYGDWFSLPLEYKPGMNISHEHEKIKLTSSPIFHFRDVWFIQINSFISWNLDDKNVFTLINRLPQRCRIRFSYESDSFFGDLSVIAGHTNWGGWIFEGTAEYCLPFLYLHTFRTCPDLFNSYLKVMHFFIEDQFTNVQLEQPKSRKGKRQLACGTWNSIYVKESSEMYLLGVQAFDFNNTTHTIPLLLCPS